MSKSVPLTQNVTHGFFASRRFLETPYMQIGPSWKVWCSDHFQSVKALKFRVDEFLRTEVRTR